MRYRRRANDLHRSLRAADTGRGISEAHRHGVAVSTISLVAFDGQLEFVRFGEFHCVTLVRIEILAVPAKRTASQVMTGALQSYR